MFTNLRNFIGAVVFAAGSLVSGPSNAVPIGDLSDGLLHVGSVTGEWSLSVNAGDVVTVTARRLQPNDIWSFAEDTSGAGFCTGTHVLCNNGMDWGDDQLPPFAGGPYGDPQYTFASLITGTIYIDVDYYNTNSPGVPLNYNVIATVAAPTAGVPEPTTLALLGLGLAGFGFSRRKTK